MTQQEKQLLLVDLCARLPYNVVIHCTNSDADYSCFLTTDILHEIQNGHEYYDYKPYLRPMSSMTEEEDAEYRKNQIKFIDSLGKTHYNNDYETYDWLNSHHFDYRSLIEKGLAIKATKDMYNTKTE